ncbi:MAG: hypothetical protein QM820_26740 [Minicystis sp.]
MQAQRIDVRRRPELVRQAHLVALAVADERLTAIDHAEVRRRRVPYGEAHGPGLSRRIERRARRQRPELLLDVGHPGVRPVDLAFGHAAGEPDGVLLMIEDDDPVGAHEPGIRDLGRRRTRARRAEKLVAEIPDIPTHELERDGLPDDRDAGDLRIEQLQHVALAEGRPAFRGDGEAPLGRPGMDDLRVRPGGVTHVAEARDARLGARAVEPERGRLAGEEGDEGDLGIAVEIQPPGEVPERPARGRGSDDGPRRPRGPVQVARGHVRSFVLQGLIAVAPGAGVRACEPSEVGEQRAAVLRADRLRMELHTPDGPGAVTQAHQQAFLRPRRPLEDVREIGHEERVIAHCREGIRQVGKQLSPIVEDLAPPAVHGRRRMADAPPEVMGNPLMPEAHAEHRASRPEDGVRAHAEILRPVRRARARGDHDVVERRPRHELFPGELVVGHHDGLGPVDLGEQLVEIPCERVVVVDQDRSQHGIPFFTLIDRSSAGTGRHWEPASHLPLPPWGGGEAPATLVVERPTSS